MLLTVEDHHRGEHVHLSQQPAVPDGMMGHYPWFCRTCIGRLSAQLCACLRALSAIKGTVCGAHLLLTSYLQQGWLQQQNQNKGWLLVAQLCLGELPQRLLQECLFTPRACIRACPRLQVDPHVFHQWHVVNNAVTNDGSRMMWSTSRRDVYGVFELIAGCL